MKLTAIPLDNAWARLEPLVEAHREGGRAAASDPSIWKHWPRDVVGDGWDKTFDRQLGEQADGSWMIFTVIDLHPRSPDIREASDPGPKLEARQHGSRIAAAQRPGNVGTIVGQTCYLSIAPEHDRVEIGGTWYTPAAQATHINPASKLLMLGHAFACGAERVELKTDALNTRSRAAMLKMRAQFEGVHRRHMRRTNGSYRDTAWYSVIREDWPSVKEGLEARLRGIRE